MLKKGDKVIIRSNENESIWVGTYIGMLEKNAMPVVENDAHQVFAIGGFCVPFFVELYNTLQDLAGYKEQWNFLEKWVRGRDLLP